MWGGGIFVVVPAINKVERLVRGSDRANVCVAEREAGARVVCRQCLSVDQILVLRRDVSLAGLLIWEAHRVDVNGGP